MHIEPFATEEYFALYEFTAQHLLAASDCETVSIGELLALAGETPDRLLDTDLGYTESTGSAALRDAIAQPLSRLGSDSVVVVNAPEEGIYLTMRALLEPDDDVVVMSPCYDSLRNVAQHIGARVHPWTLRATAAGWGADLEELRALLAEHKPTLVIVNLPHNPTGHLPTPDEFGALLSMCERQGARVFCDEMYRGLEGDGVERLRAAADESDNAISLGGLSKTYGLPGLRAGWLLVPDDDARDRIIGWKHYTTICPPAPVQTLAITALAVADALAADHRRRIAANAELARAFFDERQGFVWRAPRAGSVALVETPWADAAPVCHRLAAEAGVVLLPGACLGAPAGFVRIGLGRAGFAAGLSALGEALLALPDPS